MNVAMIVAPFGPIEYPLLGPSLLKPAIESKGAACSVRYASIEFAARIGFGSYISTYYADPPLLLGERVFARAMFDDDVPTLDRYWRDVALPFAEGVGTQMDLRSVSQPRLKELEAAESEAMRFADELAGCETVECADVIGFTSTFAQHVASLAVARRIKERFADKIVIIGGANCEGVAGIQTLRSFPFVDYVSTGPADISFPRFIEQLDRGEDPSVPGIVSQCDVAAGKELRTTAPEEPALDDLPYPDFSDFFSAYADHPNERMRVYSIPVEGARGCWWGEKHHCIFCGINGEQMPYRRKSAARLRDEIEYLVDRYDVDRVWATDNILDPRYFSDLVPLLTERRKHSELFFETKANLRRDQMAALADAGITRLQPGIESLDTSVLALMKKGTTAIDNLQVLKWAAELGILLQWNIICGFPGEDPRAYKAMAELMKLLPHLPAPKACSQITIDRFSPLFDAPGAFGIAVKPAKSYRYVYALKATEIEDLAYFHSQVSESVDTTDSLAVPEYAHDVAHQVQIWRKQEDRVRFQYEPVDADGVVIYDTRPSAECDRRELDGAWAVAMRHIDSASTSAAVHRRAEQEGTGVSPSAVCDALDGLVECGYAYAEGGKYLGLATRIVGDAHRRRPTDSIAGATA